GRGIDGGIIDRADRLGLSRRSPPLRQSADRLERLEGGGRDQLLGRGLLEDAAGQVGPAVDAVSSSSSRAANAARDSGLSNGPGSIRNRRVPARSVQTARAFPDWVWGRYDGMVLRGRGIGCDPPGYRER